MYIDVNFKYLLVLYQSFRRLPGLVVMR